MGALKYNKIESLRGEVRGMASKMGKLHPNDFTHDEMLELFVPKRDHDILRRAAHVASLGYNTNVPSFCGTLPADLVGPFPTAAINVTLFGDDAPLAPKKPKFQSGASPELIQRFTSWVTQRMETARDWGRVMLTLETLNNICDAPNQMRFLWACMPALVRNDNHNLSTSETAKLTEFKVPARLPAVSPELRALCALTAGTVAAVQLLGETLDQPMVLGAVGLSVDSISMDEPGVGSYTTLC